MLVRDGVFFFLYTYFFLLSENNIYTVYREQLLRGIIVSSGCSESLCRESRCRWSRDGVIGLREVRVLGVCLFNSEE